MPPPNTKTWNEYRKFVVEKLDEHSNQFGEIFKRLSSIEIELAKLKVKAGIWGLIGGVVPVSVMIVVYLLRGLWLK